jgi:hypothetical protein
LIEELVMDRLIIIKQCYQDLVEMKLISTGSMRNFISGSNLALNKLETSNEVVD